MGEADKGNNWPVVGEGTMRMTMDYMGDPRAHDEVLRFYGKHIEEIEEFSDQLQDWFEQSEVQQKHKESYEALLNKWLTPDDIEKVALRAAATLVHTTSKEHRTRTTELQRSGEGLSLTMAYELFCRLEGHELVMINGTEYNFGDAIMTTRSTKRKLLSNNRIIVFGTMPEVGRLARKYHDHLPRNRVVPQIAEAVDWQKLLDDLKAVAKY